jgi:hypothetical protein
VTEQQSQPDQSADTKQERPGDSEPKPERQAGDEPYFLGVPLGAAWGESITKKRAAKLEATLQAWNQEADHGERKGPFDNGPDNLGIPLTGADVFWLAARSLAGTGEAQAVAEQMDRLRALPRMVKEPTIFLSGLNLSGAFLFGADLSKADLSEANLSKADLSETDLSGADLSGADLSGADLSGADLSGAHLSRVTFNTDTDLSGVKVTDTPGRLTAFFRWLRRQSSHGPISVADLHWNDVDLTAVDWSDLRRLGDERGGLRAAAVRRPVPRSAQLHAEDDR